MTVAIGLVVTLICLLGGFAVMGGKLAVLAQPWEFVIIGGTAIGTFIVANPMPTIKDSGKAFMEAISGKGPKQADYLEVLGLMNALMRMVRTKTRTEVESHIDAPGESAVFQAFPKVTANPDLTNFICDYVRIILLGNAKPHEVEALMEEEIHTIGRDRLKPYHAIQAVADALPALGIVAAVLGVIKAMGALDQSPEVLGELIGAALVGTFVGIFLAYGVTGPIATKIKSTREKQNRIYVIVKQTLVAFISGASPQIALEFGRKTISSRDRPTIDMMEEAMMTPVPALNAAE